MRVSQVAMRAVALTQGWGLQKGAWICHQQVSVSVTVELELELELEEGLTLLLSANLGGQDRRSRCSCQTRGKLGATRTQFTGNINSRRGGSFRAWRCHGSVCPRRGRGRAAG